jgi:hypothetical protein
MEAGIAQLGEKSGLNDRDIWSGDLITSPFSGVRLANPTQFFIAFKAK